jgi:2'-5' RNA ligase
MARNEHLVVVMLEPMPAGQEFEVWPPHITLVPWFPAEDTAKLDKILSKVAARHRPLDVKAGGVEQWGSKERFEVIKIEDQGELHALHNDVFDCLEKNGFPIHQKDYLGEKYTPHITLRNLESKNFKLSTDQIIAIGRFTLIKQLRLKGSGRMIKTLVRDYELGG